MTGRQRRFHKWFAPLMLWGAAVAAFVLLTR
jgi:hypothetical protein